MAEVPHHVLVIGGGIGGMAAAIALAKLGSRVEIIEKGPEWKVYGAGLTITGPTLRAFRDLGLFDAIAKHGAFAKGGQIYLFDGTLLTESATPAIEEGLPASGGIMRPKLHQIMTEEVARLGIDVRIGVIASEFDQAVDEVKVSFSDGTTGNYDLVIGHPQAPFWRQRRPDLHRPNELARGCSEASGNGCRALLLRTPEYRWYHTLFRRRGLCFCPKS